MPWLKDQPLTSEKYNSLPYVLDNEDVPTHNRKDIDDLLAVFRKHGVPHGIRVKLVHKHFDIGDGEAIVHREVAVPTQGAVSIMGPMETKRGIPVCGLNYMVDDEEKLQAYEYSVSEQPNMQPHEAFLEEFCSIVTERGLQNKLGLRIGLPDTVGFTEFEVAEKRGTIMVPQKVDLTGFGSADSVTTEWEADRVISADCNSHCFGHQVCKAHPPKVEPPELQASRTNDWFLAGKRMRVGSPLQLIVSTAASKL